MPVMVTMPLNTPLSQAYLAANTDLMTNNKPEVIVVTFDAEMDGATAGETHTQHHHKIATPESSPI